MKGLFHPATPRAKVLTARETPPYLGQNLSSKQHFCCQGSWVKNIPYEGTSSPSLFDNKSVAWQIDFTSRGAEFLQQERRELQCWAAEKKLGSQISPAQGWSSLLCTKGNSLSPFSRQFSLCLLSVHPGKAML